MAMRSTQESPTKTTHLLALSRPHNLQGCRTPERHCLPPPRHHSSACPVQAPQLAGMQGSRMALPHPTRDPLTCLHCTGPRTHGALAPRCHSRSLRRAWAHPLPAAAASAGPDCKEGQGSDQVQMLPQVLIGKGRARQ